MKKEKAKPLWTTLTTAENVAEVHRQLFAGVGPYEIAKKVQAMSPPMFEGRDVNAVTNWFNNYRKKFVLPEQTKALGEAAKFKGMPGLRKRLDVIAELEELAVTNRERLAKGLKMEAQSPIPLDAVSKLALTLGTTLEKLAHLYLETGLMHRVPKRVEASLANLAGGRPLFTFTEEEAARFSHAKLIEGMVVPDANEEEDGDDRGI
jgi:hypothetical protein